LPVAGWLMMYGPWMRVLLLLKISSSYVVALSIRDHWKVGKISTPVAPLPG